MALPLQRIDPMITRGVGAGIAAAFVIGSSLGEDVPAICLFRRCTGGYCPGCGGSRAAVALLRGDVASAWSHHPWVVLLGLQALVLMTASLGGAIRFTARHRNQLLVFNLGLGMALWIVRLVMGTIPIPFA